MDRLAIAEDTEFEITNDDEEGVGSDLSLCLVGRFLTDKAIRVSVMKDKMVGIWSPERGVQMKEVEPGLFLFHFYHHLDIQWVLKRGPWSFDRRLLIVGVLLTGVVPQEISLNKVSFCVQIHDLPIGFMSEAVGKGLGDFIGKFLEYDSHKSSNFWCQYMRICVLIDVQQPLRCTKKIKRQGGEARVVSLKYECLEAFGYLCGIIDHMESLCDKLFTMTADDGSRGWGPHL